MGRKSARGAVLGFAVSKQKPREVILNPGGGSLRTVIPELSWRFRAKKWFEKALQSTITKDDGLQDYINRVSRNLLVGTRVELFDLIDRSELNGITGFICDEKDEKNRYPVQLLHAVETRIVKEDDFEIVPPPIYLDEKNFRVLDSAISADVRCGAKALEDNERDLHLNGYGTPDFLKKQQGVNSKKSSSGKKIKKRKLK